ncbi:MAG TPA: trypsin-like peptidase domain-containing protein [Candidatus Methylacidiphilales bacterium]|nr:trypsin-like peptidase domain-containing protein [Candidatus Methylacidiphilales bacterium]
MSRFLLPAIILGLVAGTAYADGVAHVVQKFTGADARASTPTFTVQDKWEVLWVSPIPINLTLLSPGGTVIAGVQGSLKGSFYQPVGGTYYLQVDRNGPASKAPWNVIVAEVASGTHLTQADAGPIFSNFGDTGYTPPDSVLAPGTIVQSPPAAASPNPVPPIAASPNPVPPIAASPNPVPPTIPFASPVLNPPTVTLIPITPVPPPTPSPPSPSPSSVTLTEEQARAVVLIKGDNAEGAGFLIKTPDGPAILTNIHVIANNPNLEVTTNSGAFIKVLSMKGASDRDLALLSIQDAGYNYLEMVPDISRTAQVGDVVITPGNSQDSATIVNTTGKILGIGPDQIDFDNPIGNRTNSGGPVFHLKSDKVLGVVTTAMKMESPDELDKASFANRNSAISNSVRYFGLRVDTVVAWVPIDSRRFQVETVFLDQFHEQSRRLDAYINTRNNQPRRFGGRPDNGASKIYLNDVKIMKANDTFIQQASGADAAQRADALRGLFFDLQCVADLNMDQIQNPINFYSFDQQRARDEIAYRKALKAEIASLAGDPDGRFTALLPQTDNNNPDNPNNRNNWNYRNGPPN